jgi:hypothetical protein
VYVTCHLLVCVVGFGHTVTSYMYVYLVCPPQLIVVGVAKKHHLFFSAWRRFFLIVLFLLLSNVLNVSLVGLSVSILGSKTLIIVSLHLTSNVR